MKDLTEVVLEYLKQKTNYALLITGKWGIGKTYYYKNNLVDEIKSTSTLADDSKKFKTIHVSLFGLKSIEEIQSQVFLALYPFLKNKAIKLSLGIGKAIARGAMALSQLGDIDQYVEDVKPESKDIISFNDIVICFDDFEIKNSNLPIEELIGFINSLVEHNDVKVILIANEDKIEENYPELKEKVIGVTIEYLPNIKDTLIDIIDDKYSGPFNSYSKFLKERIYLLTEFSMLCENNFRTLIYAFDKMQNIYYQIKVNVLDKNGEESIIANKINELMRFVLGICIEYRNHSITFLNREDLNSPTIKFTNFDFSNSTNKDQEVEIEASFKDQFIEKYFENETEYRFYNSIYSYLTGASRFNFELFESEIEQAYNTGNKKVEKHYQVLNDLNYLNYFNLSEKEYRSLTREMIKYAEAGKYNLDDCLTVYRFATRFGNILSLDPTKLKEKIIKGFKKGLDDRNYTISLDFYLDVPAGIEFEKELKEIREEAILINEEVKKRKEKEDSERKIKELENEWENFKESLVSDKSKWRYTPFLEDASANKIYIILNKFPSDKLWEFADLMRIRYGKNPPSSLKEEITFIQQLSKKLEPTTKSRKRKTVRNHLLNLINHQLKTAIEGFKN